MSQTRHSKPHIPWMRVEARNPPSPAPIRRENNTKWTRLKGVGKVDSEPPNHTCGRLNTKSYIKALYDAHIYTRRALFHELPALVEQRECREKHVTFAIVRDYECHHHKNWFSSAQRQYGCIGISCRCFFRSTTAPHKSTNIGTKILYP